MAISGNFTLSVTFTGLCLFVRTKSGLHVLLSRGMVGMEHLGAIKYEERNATDHGTGNGKMRTHLPQRHYAFDGLIGSSGAFDFSGMPLNLTEILSAKVKKEMMDPRMTAPGQQQALVASFHFPRGRIVGPHHSSFWTFTPPGEVRVLGSGYTVEIDEIAFDPTTIEQQWRDVGLPALWPKKVSSGATSTLELNVEVICVPANEIDVDPQGPFDPPKKGSTPTHFPMLFDLFEDGRVAVSIAFDRDEPSPSGRPALLSVDPLVCMVGGGDGP